MTVAEYVVDQLVKNGITDVFGVPGGVILDLLYSLDKRQDIQAHLSYHEQAAAFEACGYAQVNHSLGMAYATRGPGFTNLITGIADAYADSIPVLFITAHSGTVVGHEQRFEREQEMDAVHMVTHITKYAAAVDHIDMVKKKLDDAICYAMTGRKGPVLLDFSASLWNKEIGHAENPCEKQPPVLNGEAFVRELFIALEKAKRPVFLLGDGLRQAGVYNGFAKIVDHTGIPVLTSRCAQDVGSICKNYYGYVGSHGMRYSNFIFAKADLVIALGNRLAFPLQSQSFTKALHNKQILMVDVDPCECKRRIPNTVVFNARLEDVARNLEKSTINMNKPDTGWLTVCEQLKYNLDQCDVNQIVVALASFMKQVQQQFTFVTDVGNNEFWASRAYELSGIHNRILYSKSFGALGSSVCKAIGVHYQTRKPVVCFVGDQGFQFNIQELQFVAQEKLPIVIFVVNNGISGMIRDHENYKYPNHFVHSTRASGYGIPDIGLVANTYGIEYQLLNDGNSVYLENVIKHLVRPVIIEGVFDENIVLTPSLPKGQSMQDMVPELNRKVFEMLERL